jgi:hypothetical protein
MSHSYEWRRACIEPRDCSVARPRIVQSVHSPLRAVESRLAAPQRDRDHDRGQAAQSQPDLSAGGGSRDFGFAQLKSACDRVEVNVDVNPRLV